MSAERRMDPATMMKRLAMAWDGQWFLKTAEHAGIEVAIEINARVRRSFARIEMREALVSNGLPTEGFEELDEAMVFLWDYLQAGKPGTDMDASYEVAGDTATVWVQGCPAWEGAKKAGLERVDQACVACPGMWQAWIARLLSRKESEIRVEIPHKLSEGDSLSEIRISLARDATADLCPESEPHQ